MLIPFRQDSLILLPERNGYYEACWTAFSKTRYHRNKIRQDLRFLDVHEKGLGHPNNGLPGEPWSSDRRLKWALRSLLVSSVFHIPLFGRNGNEEMIRAGIHPIEALDSRLLCHKSLLRGENGRVVPKIGFRKQKMPQSARIPKIVSCHFWLLSGKNGRDVPKIGVKSQKMQHTARILSIMAQFKQNLFRTKMSDRND